LALVDVLVICCEKGCRIFPPGHFSPEFPPKDNSPADKPLHSCLLFHYTSKKLSKHVDREGKCPRLAEKGGGMSVGELSGGEMSEWGMSGSL